MTNVSFMRVDRFWFGGKYTREGFDYIKEEFECGIATLILDKSDGSKEWSGF